ncbi:hypothetical protein [Anaeromyxobacter oryzae]|uniref:Lipoprotein n=1 Tax=Anaeromyxobacter oryzae TaxID=2918170 RepID=A0ABM7WRC1_9BACT|nr:hypothetical protein [Anaeromyxobacter oryzae]BDG02019.1 hypothetical protein AMOR_10150 [Anaeromyxobacter oryzae]
MAQRLQGDPGAPGGRAIRPAGAHRRIPLSLAATALLSAGCAAHLPRNDEPVAFLERSTVAVSSDRRQAFEAHPALHVLLWNGLDAPELLDGGGTAAVLSLSFLGDFRIWRDASTPVRTPTYEPRARLQLFRVARLGAAPGEPSDALEAHRLVAALSFDVGHRSNGEEGCALADHVRDGKSDFACTATTDPPSDRLNVRDGSFTTNYAGAGAALRWLPARGGALPDGSAFTAAGGVEWNVPCDLGACMPAEMRARYGAVRAAWSLEAELPVPAARLFPATRGIRVRAGAEGAVHLGTSGRGPWSDFSAEVAVMRATRGGLDMGLFLRRHQGPDYLNIHFEERLDAWTFGLVVDPAPPDALDPPRP